jgi:hypothetical protein
MTLKVGPRCRHCKGYPHMPARALGHHGAASCGQSQQGAVRGLVFEPGTARRPLG